ncbi:TadE-like protein [Actinomyces bovis]|uniref:TadE-like protein n=1 Tax=Actinomyces bovis TaxID=1658 RepID=A0ABY1VPM3_9ACTO|nr:TadE family protein [Actinomyces bovis]SPT53627.1 TadE-like protein [Actinomyces bovis]VEG55684.1 TadE-like protein [Actinomyces israelii]
MKKVTARSKESEDELGASSVELLVFFPLLLAIILLTVQVSLTWYGNEVALSTARETARTLRTNANAPGVQAAAVEHAKEYAARTAHGGLEDLDVQVQVGPDQVTVTVSGRSMDVFWGLSPRVSATVSGPVERFKGDL